VSALVIARTELLRLLRDRSNLFFVFIFPLLLVVLIGSAFGGGMDQRLGVVAPHRRRSSSSPSTGSTGWRWWRSTPRRSSPIGSPAAGWSPACWCPRSSRPQAPPRGDRSSSWHGATAAGLGLRALVDAAVTERAAVLDAARFASLVDDGSSSQHLEIARELQATLPGVEVRVEDVGGDELAREFAGLGQFDLGASSQLFLFTFLTSLAAAGALIQSRQLGVARRMLATPTSTTAVLVGFGSGRLLIAVTQAAYIVLATVLLFQVDWGAPLPTTAVILAFCLVAGGAGMLVGAVMRNDSQAAGVGLGWRWAWPRSAAR
jgi:ABC-2 type transport system permease protein